jgi:hypothetical protein
MFAARRGSRRQSTVMMQARWTALPQPSATRITSSFAVTSPARISTFPDRPFDEVEMG